MARRGGLSDRDDLESSLQELRELMAAAVPQAFAPPAIEWKPIATVIVARLRDMLRSISLLMAAGHESDALLVLRTIYEHVVMFCWIAANPDERTSRVDQSLRAWAPRGFRGG
jgi:hypothetical protein